MGTKVKLCYVHVGLLTVLCFYSASLSDVVAPAIYVVERTSNSTSSINQFLSIMFLGFFKMFLVFVY